VVVILDLFFICIIGGDMVSWLTHWLVIAVEFLLPNFDGLLAAKFTLLNLYIVNMVSKSVAYVSC